MSGGFNKKRSKSPEQRIEHSESLSKRSHFEHTGMFWRAYFQLRLHPWECSIAHITLYLMHFY